MANYHRNGTRVFCKVFRRSWITYCLLILSGSLFAQTQPPFSKGVNLTTWFQAESATQIQFSKYTKKDFQNIKSLGCDVVRLPINLHSMTDGSPDYVLDPLFLAFLDTVVNWTEALHLHLILDNHTFDPATNTDPNIGPVLIKVWTQMAAHYKNRSEYIYYEVLNEPHGIADATWGNIQLSVINAIRTQDTQHYIVVGPANWNNYANLSSMPVYADPKLIYTFHFYDPFLFTHQGASWTDPSLVPLAGVPFPYRAADMPPTPPELQGSWVAGSMNNYVNDGTVAKVKSQIDVAVNFKNARNVPIFCGEFGVFNVNSNNTDRVNWYKAVKEYFATVAISWTIWDYQGGFGLFKKDSNELFDYDLNVPLLQGLGLTVPVQKVYVKRPKTTGFSIYSDFIGEGIFNASNPGAGTLDFYSETTPEEGARCIYWTDVARYTGVVFDFKPDVDLSLLESHDHVLEFQVRSNTPAASFDIRFLDTKTGTTDHPWRMGKTIDNTVAPFDGEWHHVTLSLKDMEEKGSFDNGFFTPEGKFDWKAIDKLEIVAEQQALTDIDFWFDDIRISGEEVPYTDPVMGLPGEANDLKFNIYPNPMHESTLVQFSLAEAGPVSLVIYNLTGQKIKTMATGTYPAGDHAITWDGKDDNSIPRSAGLYFICLQIRDQRLVKKVMRY